MKGTNKRQSPEKEICEKPVYLKITAWISLVIQVQWNLVEPPRGTEACSRNREFEIGVELQ